MRYCRAVQAHYRGAWQIDCRVKKWHSGPVGDLPEEFSVLEFPPWRGREMWTYATSCMSQAEDVGGVELHLFSPVQCDSHVELLTAVAHYHRTGMRLGLHHTVDFGRPWMEGSLATCGYVSLPYLDGRNLEVMKLLDGSVVRFLWLVPITLAERQYVLKNGTEALESLFEREAFDYLDPARSSVVW